MWNVECGISRTSCDYLMKNYGIIHYKQKMPQRGREYKSECVITHS